MGTLKRRRAGRRGVDLLRQEFYGLPADPELMLECAVKEAVHKWGHGAGLRHCPRYDCAMHASHSIELLYLKENGSGGASRLAPREKRP